MKVLIVGSGGREHALAWKISKSGLLTKLYCAPSNGGIDKIATSVSIKATDIESLKDFAISNKIDLTIVGPELPLALGISDLFEANGLKIFGPNKNAARLESSKIFAKELMTKYNISTAPFKAFNNFEDASEYLKTVELPVVIKEDVLAAGKGVTTCFEKQDVELALCKAFAKYGNRVIVEDYIEGKEFTVFAISDGKKAVVLPPVKDYKTLNDNNRGPNTGGMGSYAVVPWIKKEHLQEVQQNIIDKILLALNNEGITYKGIIYAGLIIDENNKISVLEFNCRFGDPETQALLPLLEDDLLDICNQAASGDLQYKEFKIKDQDSICVVLISRGYPEKFETGYEIKNIKDNTVEDELIFIAGASWQEGKLVSSSGRVINVVCMDNDFESAYYKAYELAKAIDFNGKVYRKDIGIEAIEYQKANR